MLVPVEAAEPVVAVECNTIDSKPIPELGFSHSNVAAPDSDAEPDADEEEKEAKERRARARRRARERRARLRTIGFAMLVTAGFVGVIVLGIALLQYVNRTALTGTVTFDGRPIANGYISFTPKDGVGQAVSARIINGRYELRRIAKGENVVLITAVADQQFSKSRADPTQDEGKAPGPVEDLVGPDAIGNNRVVTIQRGSHVLNFDLKAPPPKEPAKDNAGQPKPG
jgi:hypothetical protein